jgi:hypothetical protein
MKDMKKTETKAKTTPAKKEPAKKAACGTKKK